MPTIAAFLTDPARGWAQMGADFYYPANAQPHLHLRVTNAQNQINDYPDIRNHFAVTQNGDAFFLLTYGGQQPNVPLMTAGVNAIGNAIRAIWGEPQLTAVQFRINRITGRGIDV
jgi:hypothetical protein